METLMQIADLQSLCADIRAVLPDAVIAGGAVRDTLHSRPVKDIDVMTCTPVDPVKMVALAKLIGGNVTPATAESASGDESFEYLITRGLVRPPINVIDLNYFDGKDAIENVFDFDFGISQVAVTPDGVLHSGDYLRDALSGTITYMGHRGREKWRIESSARRLIRLKEKYPTFKFIDCEPLEAM